MEWVTEGWLVIIAFVHSPSALATIEYPLHYIRVFSKNYKTQPAHHAPDGALFDFRYIARLRLYSTHSPKTHHTLPAMQSFYNISRWFLFTLLYLTLNHAQSQLEKYGLAT